jgi:hypothetical protein
MVDRVIGNNRKKKVKRLSAPNSASQYYPSAFISKPCEQLFGPQPFDLLNTSDSSTNNYSKALRDKSFNSLTSESISNDASLSQSANSSVIERENSTPTCSSSSTNILTNKSLLENFTDTNAISNVNNSNNDKFEYIPAPKWNKLQNAILEEFFRKTRYPKQHELKLFAQRFHVMDSDIEEWFRKRRGRDRKTRRKNEVLKNLIDNYIDK